MSIQKVAVIGGSGNLGIHIIQALLEANFTVTAVSRLASTATFPDGVNVKRADLSSVDSIKDAITGNDAVISVAGHSALGSQRPFIDAAIAAGVPRFMPSEFGIPLPKYRDTKIVSLLADKLVVLDYLEEVAAKHDSFSWTALSTGLFFDWALKSGQMFLDHENHKARVVDSGDQPFSSSSVGFIGRAVAAVLQRPAQTANKYLNVAGLTTTQNEIVRVAEELTGSKFEVSRREGAELEKIAGEKLAKHDYSAFTELLEQHLYADGPGHALEAKDSAHELLGLQLEDLRESVQKILD